MVFVAFVDAAQNGVHTSVSSRFQGEELSPRPGVPAGRFFRLSNSVLDRLEGFGISHLIKGTNLSERVVRGSFDHVRRFRWRSEQEFVSYGWESNHHRDRTFIC